MSDDVGRELRNFRGFINRDEAGQPPPAGDRPRQPLPEDSSDWRILHVPKTINVVYGVLMFIGGALILIGGALNQLLK